MDVLIEKPNIKVAVGLMTDDQQRLLITQRSPHISHGGYWEFPGGKLEIDESPEMALIRELKEEVGVDVIQYQFLGEVHHPYETYTITLYGYHVFQYRGVATCRESQTALKWIEFASLQDYAFPKANEALIQLFSQGRKDYRVNHFDAID